MRKMTKIITIASLVLALGVNTGCSIPFFSKEKPAQVEPPQKGSDNSTIDAADDKAVKKLVSDYFTTLYKEPVENYSQSSSTGSIPANIKPYIAQRTINEGDNNPEVGIHLPRYVEMNGFTIIGYELLNDTKDLPTIESTYIGKKNDSLLYYVKVSLKAKCLPNDTFNAAFPFNAGAMIYNKPATIDENLADFMKVQVKFDVEALKDGGGFKILTAQEANIKPGFRNRLLKQNNDYMVRLSYLNTKDAGDASQFNNEKAVIESFFNNLLMLDKERMNLLKTKWDIDANNFKTYLGTLGITKSNNKEIVAIGDDYKQKFAYESFPIQVNMEKIKKYSGFNVTLHPAYSEKQKRYIVKFDASVVKINGMVGNEEMFKYDYFVSLSGKDDTLAVSNIRLNEYYNVPAPRTPTPTQTPDKK